MLDVPAFADQADVIIGGFAVAPCAEGSRVANLNTGRGVAAFSAEGALIEANMDGIELAIARGVPADAMAYAEV